MTLGHAKLGWNRKRPLWLALAGVGVVSALMGAGLMRAAEPHSVSEVRREVHDVLLRKSEESSFDHGGVIGPWHVAATSFDEATGDFHEFRLRSGSINLGAAQARLIIDHERDTFSFKLRGVVIMRVPENREINLGDHHLIPLDSFVLGPAKYHRRIVAD